MRNRIVVWGRNAQEERVLIGLELLASQNIVKIETFTEKDVSDEVYKKFMDKWRKSEEVELPDPHKAYARELSVTDGILPEELKVEQSDMINRAQTEWHYLVLSEKLKSAYDAELAEINDRIERADKYDSNLWGQLKSFWEKIQGQLRDKTLMRDHGNRLRKDVDKLFTKMKEMREKVNEEVKEKSAEAVTQFATALEDLEKRTEQGTHLRKVFDDLRKLQSKFHNTTFSRDDRKLVYDRIDKAFKNVKAKRNGGDAGGQRAASALGRTQSRYEGLLKAIEKMERSIGRDKKDLEFEHRRIERTDGQLEAQIRQAKIKMIQSRIDSKGEKLEDMAKTKTQLEDRMKREQKKIEKEEKRKAERAAAEAVKAKIAAEATNKEVSPEEKAKLEAAAASIKAGKAKKGNNKQSANGTTTPLIANAVAISEIVGGEATTVPTEVPAKVAAAAAETPVQPAPEDPTPETPAAVETPVAEQDPAADTSAANAETPVEAAPVVTEVPTKPEESLLEKASDFLEKAGEQIEDVIEDAVDTAKAVAQVAGEKIGDAVEEIKEEIREISEEE
ncbi:hypothetical protein CEQ90_02015 [Lewinellaceae bacterium SD302]|nr:hypothetical protein CEQ90_02015 [Lewinellaceae bacterium SD302]